MEDMCSLTHMLGMQRGGSGSLLTRWDRGGAGGATKRLSGCKIEVNKTFVDYLNKLSSCVYIELCAIAQNKDKDDTYHIMSFTRQENATIQKNNIFSEIQILKKPGFPCKFGLEVEM